MKNVFSLPLTENAAADLGNDLGRIRVEDGKMYRLIANCETATDFALGDVVFHKLSDGVNMSKYGYKCLSANLSVAAGVVVATAGILSSTGTSPRRYGWVQVFGENASVNVSGATTGGTDVAAGDYLKGVNAAVYLIRDAATQALYRRNVQILEAVGTTTTPAAATKKGFVNCI